MPRKPWRRATASASSRISRALGVLAAQVDVAVAAVGRERGDRHRLDHRERVALHHDAVLECPGLGLVGVADQVVGMSRLLGDRLPLDAGRERGAAAAHQARVLDLADHALRCRARTRGAAPRSRRGRGSRAGCAGRRRRSDEAAAARARPAAGTRRRRRLGLRELAPQRGDRLLGLDRRQHLLAPAARRRRSASPRERGRTGPGTGCAARCSRPRRGPRARSAARTAAISSSEPWQRQATSSQMCSTRGGRGSIDSRP